MIIKTLTWLIMATVLVVAYIMRDPGPTPVQQHQPCVHPERMPQYKFIPPDLPATPWRS